jgi:hypothetical protein
MSDDSVTAAELDELQKRARFIVAYRGHMIYSPLITELADALAALRRERDAAQRLATEYEKGLWIAEQMCRDLGRDIAKKDAALRAARPFVSPLVGSWKTAPGVLAQIDAALTPASQEPTND